MKIGLPGYPLAQLTGGELLKKAGTGVKKGSIGRVDVPILSDVPDKAIVKYLRTIDEILSDIIRIVEDSEQPAGSGGTAAVSQKMLQQAAVAPGDAVIYLPAATPGGDELTDGKGELIIIKDVLSSGAQGLPGGAVRQSPAVISREVARALSRIDAGIGMETGDLNSITVRDKFVISVDVRDDLPVPSIIRHGPPGVTAPSNGSDAGASGAGTASMVEKVAAFLTGRAAWDSPGDASCADGMILPDGFPGVTIRVIPSTMLRPDTVETAGRANRQEVIAEKFVLLAGAIGGNVGCGEEIEETDDDGQAALEAIKVSVKEAVRESAQLAMRGPAVRSGPVDEIPEGIRINQKGLLDVNREALAETLTGRKEEAARFVRDFGNSLHDRITYFFHPFAGLYAGGTGGAAVRGTGGKEGIADDEEDARVNLEKRMNEIRMLLESSYQLREVFMGIGLSAQTGEGIREK